MLGLYIGDRERLALMADTTTDGRRKRRASHGLAKRIGVHVTADTLAALERLSDATGYAVGVLARDAIESGLPTVRDRYRKRAGRGAGNGAARP